ncbi:hypothetical protein, partial [uncultured Marinobacter sp.]|uniref:hypothetical protein n=1 Tax=uncultured Marinobacter sp. TaxID=187379 RepID=UPI0030DA1771
CDADLEWGGDHPISEKHGRKRFFLPLNPLKDTKVKTTAFLVISLFFVFFRGFRGKSFLLYLFSVSFRGFRGQKVF